MSNIKVSVSEARDKVEDMYIKETNRFAFLDPKKIDIQYIEWLENKIYTQILNK